MARALDRLLIRCLAPNMEDIITVARIGVDQFASHETTLRLSYAKLFYTTIWYLAGQLKFGSLPSLWILFISLYYLS